MTHPTLMAEQLAQCGGVMCFGQIFAIVGDWRIEINDAAIGQAGSEAGGDQLGDAAEAKAVIRTGATSNSTCASPKACDQARSSPRYTAMDTAGIGAACIIVSTTLLACSTDVDWAVATPDILVIAPRAETTKSLILGPPEGRSHERPD
jgi:hypothetical protein